MEATVKKLILVDGTELDVINLMENVNNNGQESLRFQITDFTKELKELYSIFTVDNCSVIIVKDEVTGETYKLTNYTVFNNISKSYKNKIITVNINAAEESETVEEETITEK